MEVVGTRKNGRPRRRLACLPRARPFSLSPNTSKRLLRRLARRCFLNWRTKRNNVCVQTISPDIEQPLVAGVTNGAIINWHTAQLNLCTTATLGQKKVAVVERFKQELVFELSAKNGGRCREAAVSGGSGVIKKKGSRNYSHTTALFLTNNRVSAKPRKDKSFSNHPLLELPMVRSSSDIIQKI